MEARPVFLLEEERQLLASPLVTLQATVADQRRSALDILQSLPRPPPPSGAESSSSDRDWDGHRNDDSRRDPDRDRDKDCDRDRDEPCHQDRDGDHDRDREHRDRKSGERDKDAEKDRLEKMAEQERELEAKRVIRIRPSETMFRYTFDWENIEDAIREMNTLYQTPQEARLLYGYGLAGIDRRKLKKAAGNRI